MYGPWIGLVRGGDGSLSWTDGSALDFENWETGEPNSIPGDGEDCTQMYEWNGKWNDAHCEFMYQDYICMTKKRKSLSESQMNVTEFFSQLHRQPQSRPPQSPRQSPTRHQPRSQQRQLSGSPTLPLQQLGTQTIQQQQLRRLHQHKLIMEERHLQSVSLGGYYRMHYNLSLCRGNQRRRYCRHRDRGVRRVRSLRWPGADAQEQGLGRQEAGAQYALQRGRGRLQSHDILF